MMWIHPVRRACERLGLYALAWKLRKLDFSIHRSDLVLDVGSGSAPNPYADVLIDYDPEGKETNAGVARSNGKALVWADAQRLPFRDKVFDYSFCFHVLEHVADPNACLRELHRVSRRGYIETPNEIFDLIIPYRDHRNRISYDGEMLKVFKKSRWNVERFEERYGGRRAKQIFEVLIRNPANLHVQYYWSDEIRWMFGEEVIADGHPTVELPAEGCTSPPVSLWLNTFVSRLVKRRALTALRLLELMRCIECNGELCLVPTEDGGVLCAACGRRYGRVGGHLDFRPNSEPGAGFRRRND